MTDTANKAKILIVDDEKDITAILKSGLQKHGFSVDAFNDSSQNTMTSLMEL